MIYDFKYDLTPMYLKEIVHDTCPLVQMMSLVSLAQGFGMWNLRDVFFKILHKIAFSEDMLNQFVQLLLDITRQNSIILLKFVTPSSSFSNMKKYLLL